MCEIAHDLSYVDHVYQDRSDSLLHPLPTGSNNKQTEEQQQGRMMSAVR